MRHEIKFQIEEDHDLEWNQTTTLEVSFSIHAWRLPQDLMIKLKEILDEAQKTQLIEITKQEEKERIERQTKTKKERSLFGGVFD